MKKKFLNIMLMAVVCASASVPVYAEEANSMEEYATVTEADDFFTAVTKVIVKFENEVSGDIAPEKFHVNVKRTYGVRI